MIPSLPMAVSAELDEVLFARTRRGDRVAFVTLVTRHWNAIHRVGWNMLPDPQAAAQVAESTFLALLHGTAPFAEAVPFRTAVYRAAIRESLQRTVAAPAGATRSLGVYLPRFDVHGRLAETGSDSALDEDDLADAIRAILLRLDTLDRAAFVLRIVEQLPVDDAAVVLGTSLEEVRHRTHRASLVLTGFLGQLFETGRATRPC
jgi:DNA-directed RNA polymerase specialized sigma24 family protein